MGGSRPPRVLSERQGKWLLNLYPPLLFQRIRVIRFGAAFRTCEVHVARSLLTRNLNGTTFGGTVFAAADPIYAIMYWQSLARQGFRVQTWLKRARIEYLRPAATSLALRFELEDDEIERAVVHLRREGVHECRHSTAAIDRKGRTCAEIETEVYLRLLRDPQKGVSSF